MCRLEIFTSIDFRDYRQPVLSAGIGNSSVSFCVSPRSENDFFRYIVPIFFFSRLQNSRDDTAYKFIDRILFVFIFLLLTYNSNRKDICKNM